MYLKVEARGFNQNQRAEAQKRVRRKENIMTKLTKQEAIDMLGQYAFNKKTGKELDSRIEALCQFSEEFGNISIEINNTWSNPPKASSAKGFCLLGGTTYKYQVWAVAR